MTQQYLMDKNEGYIIGVEGEKYITANQLTLENHYFEVMITLKDDYYNVYIVDDIFVREPLNNLKEQIPKEVVADPYKYFDEEKLFLMILEHYLWVKYNKQASITMEEME